MSFLKLKKQMMKTISMILVTLFLFGGHLSVDAQFGRLKRKLKNKVERKIDQKVDQKIDEAVDDVFEEGEDNDSTQKKKRKKKYDLSNLGMEEMELTDVYEFDIQIEWLMSSEEGDDPIQMNQLMSEKNQYFGMAVKDGEGESTQGTLIFDLSKEYMIIIPEDEKQAMVTSMGSSETIANETMEGQRIDGSITVTGKQKKILGYTCQQYLFDSPEGKGEMWITEEIDLPNYDLFSYMQTMSRKNAKQTPNEWEAMKNGFLLEMTSKDREGNVAKIETIKIDTKANVKYDMKNYKAINMTGMEGLMGN